tara:strand:- start:752 stop:1294 length:543 start_codon:yes stop_codon:yes gene_type:complete
MALLYSKIQVEIIEISLKNRPEELYKASKKGTVPVLINKKGEVIDESLEIMLWALRNNKNQTWISADGNSEIDLINKNDFFFKKWLDKYKYSDRYPQFSKDYYRSKCNHILLDYEQNLNNTKYFFKDSISIADVAIFPFVRQFANVDYEWFSKNYEKLVYWYEQISSSKLFIDVMIKNKK